MVGLHKSNKHWFVDTRETNHVWLTQDHQTMDDGNRSIKPWLVDTRALNDGGHKSIKPRLVDKKH